MKVKATSINISNQFIGVDGVPNTVCGMSNISSANRKNIIIANPINSKMIIFFANMCLVIQIFSKFIILLDLEIIGIISKIDKIKIDWINDPNERRGQDY
ncbi:MAG: hypothetical protein A2Y97_06025 [Nitrospirae bacterium RBG_13_39_12]|nr:MAG: hypothetical protein A2Y97_06025 [Nitrospirae bacterium RBG_13_39_12]